MSDLRTSPHPGATAAIAGGTLWALLAVAARLVGDEDPAPGIEFAGVVTVFWIFLVLPPLLLLVGLRGLRSALGPAAGRTGTAGAVLAGVGYAAMAVGNGIEMASITAGGDEVAAGHFVFLSGVLVSAIGGIVLGIAVVRRAADRTARVGGALLVAAFPLGLAIGRLGTMLDPDQDAWFWAAVSLPTGVAWVLLGQFLATRSAVPVPAPAAAR